MRLTVPSFNTMHMEAVAAFSKQYWAIISGRLTIGTTVVETISANTTVLIFGGPFPGGDAEEVIDSNFHGYL